MNLHSSVTFPEQRFLSLAEAQRHGDFVGLRQFSERGSIHLSGEGSSPSLQSATTAFSCNLDSLFAFSPRAAESAEYAEKGTKIGAFSNHNAPIENGSPFTRMVIGASERNLSPDTQNCGKATFPHRFISCVPWFLNNCPTEELGFQSRYFRAFLAYSAPPASPREVFKRGF